MAACQRKRLATTAGGPEKVPGQNGAVLALRRQPSHPEKPNDADRTGQQRIQRPHRFGVMGEGQLEPVLARQRRPPVGLAKPARRRELLEQQQRHEREGEAIAPAAERHDRRRLQQNADAEQHQEPDLRQPVHCAKKQRASEDDEGENAQGHQLSRANAAAPSD